MVLTRESTRMPEEQASEQELVEACLRGNTSSFEPIVRRHEGRLFALLLSLCGDPDEARDLLQEAFIRAWRRLRTYDRARPLGPWLAAVARSCWYDGHRKAHRRYRHLPMESDRLPALQSAGADPSEGAMRSERAERLWDAFRRLHPREREVLLLKDIQELPYQQVAQTIGIPYGTVASRVFHARRHLRELLEEEVDISMAAGARYT